MGNTIKKEAITNYKYNKVSLSLGEELDLKLKRFIYLNDNKPTRQDYIIKLIEDDLKGLILDNTFIELDNIYYLDGVELKKNKKAVATPEIISNHKNAFVITEIPNNMDTFNKEFRSYCFNGNKNRHAGYHIFNDIHYCFKYDSEEKTIEVAIVDPDDMKYYVENDELKEKLIEDNSFVMNGLKDGISTTKLFKTSSRPILHRYADVFEINKIDYYKPIPMDLMFNYFFNLDVD